MELPRVIYQENFLVSDRAHCKLRQFPREIYKRHACACRCNANFLTICAGQGQRAFLKEKRYQSFEAPTPPWAWREHSLSVSVKASEVPGHWGKNTE